ncbi:ankyrin repeat containing protein [Corynebacterium kutscheri]|uniref:Ankyrin repeat containing protein n=1 Tax=Corynebacterium kutscheri TaxID=35755 RepID=A0A0F6TCL6_9CORY|nr:ankyrin repeat domain-containing protein [Corynebacterium kutscheri]AKE40916.1 Ankyrin repeats (3 copies) [Corynebacterium kutscheri]VEH06719.1 ankyrin repeat containing protein [Corynebacterium kutscheri]VEH09215.1 ankyrin repeat containing protein [Corynebacterium kutscheri]VEH79301.1 ankyrin repeat containing protein [Corynebacterium kutscheri]
MTSPNEAFYEDVDKDVQELATKLFEYARSGEMALLDYIDNGIAVDLMNQDGNTFLMLAAYSGQLALLEGLIQRGGDVNKLNDRGQSPLAGAIFKKEPDIVEALLSAGADPYVGHPSAIDTALMFGNEELARRMGDNDA